MSEMKERELDIRQVLVVRKDLRMPVGKFGAQLCHGSMAGLTGSPGARIERCSDGGHQLVVPLSEDMHSWLSNSFTKVVLAARGEDELLSLHQKAIDAGLNATLIRDSGRTVFDGPTYTVLSIGPHKAADVAPVTGHLPLY